MEFGEAIFAIVIVLLILIFSPLIIVFVLGFFALIFITAIMTSWKFWSGLAILLLVLSFLGWI